MNPVWFSTVALVLLGRVADGLGGDGMDGRSRLRRLSQNASAPTISGIIDPVKLRSAPSVVFPSSRSFYVTLVCYVVTDGQVGSLVRHPNKTDPPAQSTSRQAE